MSFGDIEEMEAFATRVGVPISEQTTQARFNEWLDRNVLVQRVDPAVHRVSISIPSEAQKSVLWEGVKSLATRWSEFGVRPIEVKFDWGKALRFGVSGERGLFGSVRASEFAKERGRKE